MAEKTLMQELLEAGYPREQMFNHESDLYIYVTPLTTKVVEEFYQKKGWSVSWQAPTFHSETDGRLMYDCHFQFDDYWNENCGRRCEA